MRLDFRLYEKFPKSVCKSGVDRVSVFYFPTESGIYRNSRVRNTLFPLRFDAWILRYLCLLAVVELNTVNLTQITVLLVD